MDRQERVSTVTGWIWLGTFFFLAVFYGDRMVKGILTLFGHQW